ncbi:OmpA family protein [Dyadobacter tibetensis]|uniref:OmpA family protein n=1 Tax=Dyadobacter tibetensis TaxID=1211851 RepID=UPI00046E5F05|nr:OmpA family protein [Dyadobacter tibetensis]
MKRILLLLTLLLLWYGPDAAGQDLPTSRRARDHYQKAQQAYQSRQLPMAAEWFEKVIALEPDHYNSHLRLAQIAELQRNTVQTERHFRTLIRLRPADNASGTAYLWLGKRKFQQEAYDSAQYFFEKSMPLLPSSSNMSRLTELYIASCEFARKAKEAPLEVQKKSLGDTVNFLSTQYFPVLTGDSETLLFTGQTSDRDENIYISHKKEGRWEPPTPISTDINSPNNEGTCSISADGRTLVFTACNRSDGYGSCDLYISHKQGDRWSTPTNMGPQINDRSWESQPSLSADGHILYFSSDRRDGLGKKDLWYSQLLEGGQWATPKNLGEKINSPFDEVAPFIHANGRTLFFSSDGYPGMGGFDLFRSTHTDSSWATPVNLGYPINTVGDQVGLFLTSDGRHAFYTDDEANQGRSMLYQFELPASLKKQIIPSRYAKGRVLDKATGKPMAAQITLFDLKAQAKVGEYTSDSQNGQFLAVLNRGSEYAVYVEKRGFLFKSLTFQVQDSSSVINLDLTLEPVEKDKREVLHNIFFKTGSYEIDEKSKVELNRLAEFLKHNPDLRIEVAGYTDNTGTDAANLELSRLRAKTVTEFLIKYGISPERLLTKGYGSAQPVAPNDTDENRQKNRRIEWRILS